ncbi:MAG TPA: hypothetical protein DCL44_04130 [Elusimicrobia bacterium]|nr:hypothetical protein [Elusimicrobiota bacterium]
MKNTILSFTLLLSALSAPAFAEDFASLQFTAAAPDPVMAGDTVKLQTLVVNTGSAAWLKGTYYWAGEIYTIEGENRKFLAQTETLSPQEDVAPGAAHGAQLAFTVPDNMQGSRLLYRVFLVKDGKRILETDYKGFQVIEKEFRPPVPQDFKLGGDVSISYKNSSSDGWGHSQAVTAANIVGKVRQSSFLFNTYLVHSYNHPITPNIVLLNYYAPWGVLSAGDISPSLTPLSLDGQGMRGVSLERSRGNLSWTALIGRIVPPQEPDSSSGGRFARYTGGGKAVYQLSPGFKLVADAVWSRDDDHSITISTTSNILKAQQSIVYGLNAELKFLTAFTLNSEYQLSSSQADLSAPDQALSGAAWKQEVKYRGAYVSARGSLSRVGPEFASFASPSVISDRIVTDCELELFPADWTTFSFGLNKYSDNLNRDAAKTTTDHAQTSVANSLRLMGKTTLNSSFLVNTTKGQPASVQDNKTDTMNFSLTQPWGPHTLNFGYQLNTFTDNTRLSHNLDTALISFNGAFRLSPKLSMSAGVVNSSTKDKVDSSVGKNNSLTGNFTYSMPRKAMAFQLWATLSSNKSDSPLYPADYSQLSVNLETVWAKSQNSRLTFGIGALSKTDKINSAGNSTVLNILTRYNYSF